MLLELDAGNTRIKWRLRSAQGIQGRGVDFAAALTQGEDFSAVSQVHLAAVNDDWPPAVQTFLNTRSVLRASTQACTGQLKCAYTDFHRLGIDRWLAMLATQREFSHAGHIVVDAGTAITLDIIAPQGQHLGGYIVPGVEMQKQALLHNTRQIKAEAAWQPGFTPGQNTQQCVEHGILSMCVAWLEQQAQRHPGYHCWISGGSAGLILSGTKQIWQHEPDLVLDGLTHYFELNR